MDLFRELAAYKHEQLVLCHEPSCGYQGIIAIHDTTLGPALGGTRFWRYANTDEAIVDALRLARGMTYKAAVAGLNLGGGKAVIIGDNKRPDREALFRAHGRFVETLGGPLHHRRGCGHQSQLTWSTCGMETNHVSGLQGRSGDPSPVTGYGVYVGMKATAKVRWGNDSLAGKTIRCRAAGNVASYLIRHLHKEGAKLVVTDIDAEKVKRVVEETMRRRWPPTRSTTRRPTSTRPTRWAPSSTTTPSSGSRSRSSPAGPTTSWPRSGTASSWRSRA